MDRPVASRVIRLDAGQASNVICGLCTFSVLACDEKKVLEALACTGYAYEMEKSLTHTVFRIKGKAAHTSLPHLGDNALIKALRVIHDAFSEDWAAKLIRVFGDPYGSGLGLLKDYPPMGYASIGLNMFSLENGTIHGEADVRFPKPLDAAGLTDHAQKALPGFSLRNVYEEPVFLQSPDNPFVRTLIGNYRSFYPNDPSEPYISGGVTYAKVYGGRCVAYGPRLPFDKTPTLAHQADEYVTLDHLQKICRLYAGALNALSNCEG
jgi:succinyl-diaminopimelate desuccinylase